MLTTAGLSLEQAPPISIPFRFFLTAPLFGIAAGLLLVWHGELALLSRWMPATLALTHLLTLGVLAMVMCGALLQMLPVVAGAPVPRVVLVGNLVHPLLSLGTLALVLGLLGHPGPWLTLGLGLLAGGLLIFLAGVAVALWRVPTPSCTTTGMAGAAFALLVTLGLGLFLGAGLAGWTAAPPLPLFTSLHLGFGLFGWVLLLLVGVAYQVVPMFQVTPEYPLPMRRRLVPLLLVLLLLWTLTAVAAQQGLLPSWLATGLATSLPGLAGAAAGWFAIATLRLQGQRRRKVPDLTLRFWRLGLGALLACPPLWLGLTLAGTEATQARLELLLGVLMIAGAALPLLNGMLYKIVPFLCWFHLQHRQLQLMATGVRVPNMKELLPETWALTQFWLSVLALALTLGAVYLPGALTAPAGLAWAASFALLGGTLGTSVLRYLRVGAELHRHGADLA
jgi:hypothetical protein